MAARLRVLAANPRAIDRRRCRARAVERFGADRMAEDYLAIYEEVVRTRPSGTIMAGLPAGRSNP
jgi:glycosyltransferase involved in cell wall biosynthesis